LDVEVDAGRCQGHTICAMRAPEVFELSEIDGHASVRISRPEGELQAKAREAAGSCPEQAITIR
jgi:ferredoxin